MRDEIRDAIKEKSPHLFCPGQSGNPSGRPKKIKSKTLASMIDAEIDWPKFIRQLCRKAEAGDSVAMARVWELKQQSAATAEPDWAAMFAKPETVRSLREFLERVAGTAQDAPEAAG